MAKVTKAMITQLVAIAASSTGFVMMTQEEGAAIVEAGLASVDQSNTEGDSAAVSLTDAGRAELPEGTVEASASSSGFEIDDGVEIPATVRKGRAGGYPFDKLEIGQSFHVPTTASRPDPASTLQSSVSGARARFAEETGETETVERKVYKRGEDGKSYVKGEDGKRVVESTEQVERPVTKLTRDFVVKAVGEDDPKGPGARVWRVALDA